MFDGEAFGAQVVEAVKAYVDEATAPLIARIAELEKRPTEEAVEARVQEAVRAVVEALPQPQIDEGGADAFEARADAFLAALPGFVDAAVARIPAPKDGVSVTLSDVAPLIVEEVQKAVTSLPAPKDGVGVAGAVIDRDGVLVLTLSNGDTKALGRVVGKDVALDEVERLVAAEVAKLPAPKDGKDGKDGFSLSDFDTEMQEDGRTVHFKFSRGDTTEIHELCFPVVIDRGVYRPEAQYAKGDGVTWGGSFWIAQRDTSAKPETNDDWRLAVKRGRDGKDAGK